MYGIRRPLAMAIAATLVAGAGSAWADYPDKPIRFVVPFAAGSATDQLARAVGQAVTQDAKVTVVVDNKPGANGFIAATDVAKASPDGYTVLITTNTTHAANEHLFKKLPYDPVKDYAPITALGRGGQIMVVNPSVPAKTVGEFIALARKEPGKLSFGSGSSSSRIAGELFQQMAHVELLHVPYKSNPLAITDLLGNQIQMMITDTATGLPQVKTGKLRAGGLGQEPLAAGAGCADHRRSGRQGLRNELLVCRLCPCAYAAGGGGQAQRAAGEGGQKRDRGDVLSLHRYRRIHQHAGGTGKVPEPGIDQVGPHHQGGQHSAGIRQAGAYRAGRAAVPGKDGHPRAASPDRTKPRRTASPPHAETGTLPAFWRPAAPGRPGPRRLGYGFSFRR